MINALGHLMGMQFRKFYREPSVLFWAVVFPIIMSWLLGIAFDKKTLPPLNVGVLQTEVSPHLQPPLGIRFDFIPVHDMGQALLEMKRGLISLFYRTDAQGNRVYYLDAHRAESVQAYLALETTYSQAKGSSSRVVALSQVGNRYIDFLIPGLMAFGIMGSSLWGMGWGLIDFRMKKMLRRLIVTPLPKWVFLLSHILTRLVVTGVEMGLLLLFARLYFHISLAVHWEALIVLFGCGMMSFCGIATLVASRANNAIVGNGMINVVQIPMMFLSGIFFNYHNYPSWMIPVIEKLPLTLLADSFRKILLEQVTLVHILPACGWLLVIGGLCFALGLKLFKWA